MNWLTEFSRDTNEVSEEQMLRDAIDSLSPDQQVTLGYEMGILDRPSHIEEMNVKVASAVQKGIELAREHGEELEKQALLAALGLGIAKDLAVKGITGAAKAGYNSVNNLASSGFKYAFAIPPSVGALGRKAVGLIGHNPGIAVGAAGALAGAAMAPRDQQTGKKQYLKGALVGGGVGLGANALSGGAIGNSLEKAVTGDRAILGQKAKGFVNAAKAEHPHFAPGGGGGNAAMLNLKQDLATPLEQPVFKTPEPVAAPVEHTPLSMTGDSTPLAPHLAAPPSANLQVQNIEAPASVLAAMQSASQRGSYLDGIRAQREAEQQARVAKNMAASQQAAGNYNRGAGMSESERAWNSFAPKTVLSHVIKQAALQKMANMQRLVYDPASKTFTRNHVTPSLASNSQVEGGTLADIGLPDIRAGQSLPVSGMTPELVNPRPVRPSGIPSQVHSMSGGNVLSSAPARGVGPSPQMSATPMPVKPPTLPSSIRGAGSGMARAAAGPMGRLPSLAGAVAKRAI